MRWNAAAIARAPNSRTRSSTNEQRQRTHECVYGMRAHRSHRTGWLFFFCVFVYVCSDTMCVVAQLISNTRGVGR